MLRAERRKKKREEADARQQARAKRSDKDQLAKLDREGWAAKKERARLLARIEVVKKSGGRKNASN